MDSKGIGRALILIRPLGRGNRRSSRLYALPPFSFSRSAFAGSRTMRQFVVVPVQGLEINEISRFLFTAFFFEVCASSVAIILSFLSCRVLFLVFFLCRAHEIPD